MPLAVEISLINTIEGKGLEFADLNKGGNHDWIVPPPDVLNPYQYFKCECSGPSSGYEIGIKYGGLICRILVTAWGIKYRKSTPTTRDVELVQISEKAPYRMELILI
ncbi:hypothetical protein [Sneathiella glossodoripedis]|uniref:hypothetical protein n=1 Tax=Sneathiella glossodoripedis TaxID=418853 RepID=UPI000472889F|nr:hypothetical protein [Sneathiella glossodoripedis]